MGGEATVIPYDLTRRKFVQNTAAGLLAVHPWLRLSAQDIDDRPLQKFLPTGAPRRPARPRRLLIFSLNVGYGQGHASIPTAERALTLMGQQTGAFETVVSRDPAVFERASLQRFDAVFFNNTVGNLFTAPQLRQNLIDFVYRGGGLLGVHGTAVAFMRWGEDGGDDWPEFGAMLGTRGAAHRAADEKVFVKLDDPTHPLATTFDGHGFTLQDEFFRPGGNYSRQRSRVLLSMDVAKSGLEDEPRDHSYREDRDYALAWIRHYGRGRIFHAGFGHHPAIFMQPKILEFLLAATQFALGDLPASTVPSARLTPALRKQESLGWRLGVEAYTFHQNTFFETLDKTAALGLAYVGGLSFQRVGGGIAKNLEPGLTPDELRAIRLKLDQSGLRLLTWYYQSIPGDEAACRTVFEFARHLGIEVIMSEPDPAALPLIDRFCQEYDIKVGLHNHDRQASPRYWHPEELLKVCQGRSAYLGACVDIGYWIRDGVDPLQGLELLKERLVTLQMHDLDVAGAQGQDVPWGSGQGQAARILQKMHELKQQPTMIGLEYSRDWQSNEPAVKQCIDFFNEVTLKL